jgi:hypothetical protein
VPLEMSVVSCAALRTRPAGGWPTAAGTNSVSRSKRDRRARRSLSLTVSVYRPVLAAWNTGVLRCTAEQIEHETVSHSEAHHQACHLDAGQTARVDGGCLHTS